MTMHDDPNGQLLERELEELASPRESDEQLRLTMRAELAERARPRRARRRPIRRWLYAGGFAAAAATAAIVALVGTGGSGSLSPASAAVVHHALRAVTAPANMILHVKMASTQNGVPVVGELWQETSPPFASRALKGEPGHQSESADDGTSTFSYDPATNTISRQPDASKPTFSDPISAVREQLRAGSAHDVGSTVIDGAPLYKIGLVHGLVGYFDKTTYRLRYLDDPQRDGSIVRFRLLDYRYLPLAGNRSLLSITAAHPTARLDTSSG
jgi:hypothetical protein